MLPSMAASVRSIVIALVATFAIGFGAAAAHAQSILYVDDNGPASGNGQSWSGAYRYLQSALGYAETHPSVTEIRVAQGVYHPDDGTGQTPGDRTATFQLISGLALRGGFAGIGAPNPDARSIPTYETILSGDLLDNDNATNFFNHGENSHHVVTGSGANATAKLDGFSVTAGFATGQLDSGWGSGMYTHTGSPAITQCTFRDNHGPESGGVAMYFKFSFAVITDCDIIQNSGQDGAVQAVSADITITNCTFADNSTHHALRLDGASDAVVHGCAFTNNGGLWGSAIYMVSNSPYITNCTFQGNSAEGHGGAVVCNSNSDPLFANCLFVNNTSALSGGAIYVLSALQPTFVNCTIANNSASVGGGGAFCYGPNVSQVFHNCILWNNTPGQILNQYGAATTVSYSDVQGGWAGTGNISTNPLFISSSNYQLQSTSPCRNTGNNTFVPADVETDLIDKCRIYPTIVDMGAYEHAAPSCAGAPDGCSVNSDCNDGNACTSDVCSGGQCSNNSITCNDNNACTTNSCNSSTGCVYTPITCNDSNACTTNSCNSSTGCVYTPITCNDSNACTTDSCNPSSGCAHAPVNCNDNNACTTDSCTNGTCSHGTVTCNDSDSCTVDSCSPSGGCMYTDVCGCTTNSQCNDGNSCTTDLCISGSCVHDNNCGCSSAAQCNDSDPCTLDFCISGACQNSEITCWDFDDCTNDYCSNGQCVFENICGCSNNTDCNDANACTTDVCSGGQCVNNQINCNDGISCTLDSCSNGQCIHNNTCECSSSSQCNDSIACTTDTCNAQTGQCSHQLNNSSCNDNNPCTNDTCSATLGCTYSNNTSSCNDGNSCTSSDVCSNGSCSGTPIPGCGVPSCLPLGAPCPNNNACCSNKCKPSPGSNGNKTCQ